MNIHLKIKIMTLAAEAKAIRKNELRLQRSINKAVNKGKGQYDYVDGHRFVRANLHHHRTHTVRKETRHSHIAYGFLRGRQYMEIETFAREPIQWDRIEKLVTRFGCDGNDSRVVLQRFAEWKDTTVRLLEAEDILEKL